MGPADPPIGMKINHGGSGRLVNAGDGRLWPQRHPRAAPAIFEVDAESTVIATLYALAVKGLVEPQLVEKAIKDLVVNPDKIQPQLV